MSALEIEKTALPGVVILTPQRFMDERGFFSEVWNKKTLAQHGIDVDFVQDNHSLSRDVGVMRGLHAQRPPHAQDKLLRVARGRILDVAVDVRKGSPTYGQWISVELSAENTKQIFIPKGFLHGFVTREPNTIVLYKCSDYYSAACDDSVRCNDPDLGIDWGMDPAKAILSDKDRAAKSFADFGSPFRYEQ